jgi:hypothetical protein
VPNKLFAQSNQGEQTTNNYSIVQNFTGGIIGNSQLNSKQRQMGASPVN